MYEAAKTGVVKINRLPQSFFDQLFAVKSVADVQKLVAQNSRLFERLIADETIPETTRKFLSDFARSASSGKLNETMTLKAIPLLYSMSTRAGGNSQIRWTVFSKGKGKGMRFYETDASKGKYADYSLHPKYLSIGKDLFELLNSSGRAVLNSASRTLLGNEPIPWARVDYRTVKPVKGKYAFAIVDVGMGTVGTFDKDVIASMHGLKSNISHKLVDSVLQFHVERVGKKPSSVLIMLPDSYFGKNNEGLLRSKADVEGLRRVFSEHLRHENVFVLPYSAITPSDSSVRFAYGGKSYIVGKNDLLFVYNPNKSLEQGFEDLLGRHVNVIGGRKLALISDKKVNGPVIMAAERYSGNGEVIVPERGPEIVVSNEAELIEKIREAGSRFKNSGLVIKLPSPIEVEGKALPSALFLNPASELQVRAAARALSSHYNAGARRFTTEKLMKPHAVRGAEGGLELRFYFGRRKKGIPMHRRRL